MPERGKTLVILSPGFPANEADSTCLPAQQQFVRALNTCYPLLDVVILSFHYPYSKTRYRWYGNTVIPFSGMNGGKLSRIFLWLRIWKALKRLRRKSQVMGLFSFWCSECALVGRYFGKYYAIPHLIWICGQDARRQNGLVKLIRPEPGSLVAMSDSLADEFYRNHRIRPQYVIYNGIEPALFEDTDPKRNIDIIGIGSLIPLKQFHILVNVVQELRQKFPAMQALICGQGPEQERLASLIKQSGLEQNISLMGERPHAEILRLLQQSRILLHPSNYEGFPGVCLEALYAGAQVISFCKPVNTNIDHWHIAENATVMGQQALAILASPADHSRVLVNDIKTSAVAIMQIFGYSDPAMS